MNPRVLIAIVVLVVVAIGGATVWYTGKWSAWNQPWGVPGEEKLIEIEPGWSATRIGQELHQAGIVKDLKFYAIMADFQGFGGKLKAGEYMCYGKQSPHEVLGMIALGRAYQHGITIPEGLTVEQIAERFAAVGVCDRDEFIEYARSGVTRDDVTSGDVSESPGAEGILFPDTYSLERNTPVNKIVGYMVNRFNRVYNEIAKDIPEEEQWWAEKGAGSTPSVVILASLVEREAKRDEDRAMVAGVFLNRIKKGETLGSDATLHYGLGVWDRELTREELKRDHPYNTRLKKGWPPGAICSPGRKSLEAAMKPDKTDALFFISSPDGKMHYSNTLQEHNAKKRDLRNNG